VGGRRGLAPLRWELFLLSMFTACFDAGGSQHDQRFLVVAGFVSSVDGWIKFDEAWRCRLEQDGIRYFHMVEFAQFRKEFKTGWKGNEPRRRALLSDLMEIIRRHVPRKFGCVIENKQFKDLLSKIQREKYYLDAYSFAGLYCAHQVNKWCLDEHISTVPQLVFEDGDLGKGHLADRLKKDGFGTPIFRSKKDEETWTERNLPSRHCKQLIFLLTKYSLRIGKWNSKTIVLDGEWNSFIGCWETLLNTITNTYVLLTRILHFPKTCMNGGRRLEYCLPNKRLERTLGKQSRSPQRFMEAPVA